jgi:hypothetical protein
LLLTINVHKQIVSTYDLTVSGTERETTQLEPPILAIGPTDAMLNFVW